MYSDNFKIFNGCPFWTGVEYNGQYECTKYHSICYGCDYNSKNLFRRLKFRITTEIEMWYHCWLLVKLARLKSYLFNRDEYNLFYKR